MFLIDYQEGVINPSIIISGFVIREPITAITDFLSVFIAIFYFSKFSKIKEVNLLSIVYHKYALVCFMIGFSFAGVLGHALQEYLSPWWKVFGWLFVETGIFLLAIGMIAEYKTEFRLKT